MTDDDERRRWARERKARSRARQAAAKLADEAEQVEGMLLTAEQRAEAAEAWIDELWAMSNRDLVKAWDDAARGVIEGKSDEVGEPIPLATLKHEAAVIRLVISFRLMGREGEPAG